MAIKSDKTPPPLPSSPPPRPAWRQALPQVLAVSVKNVLLLGFGMTLGFPTILIPSLSGNNPDEIFSLGPEAISWIGSINLVCVPVGCLLSGIITQPIGRKRAMQFVNLPFLAAWLLFHFSTEVWHVFFALCLTGLTGGLLEAPTLTYVAEITQPSLRGILASTSTIAIISGALIQFISGTFFRWKTVALISCIVPMISFVLLFFVPESPHWLITKRRFVDARKSLAWLRGWVSLEESEPEFSELLEQICKSEEHEPVQDTESAWKLYFRKSFLWPYSLVCFAFLLGHFSGMTTLQTYAVKIFAAVQSPIDKFQATIILGAAEVCGCILSACLVHYVGKRTMNFISLVGNACCFFTAATYAHRSGITDFVQGTGERLQSSSWIPTMFLIGTAFFSHCGIRILPWMLVGEVYSNKTRATGSGLSGGASYIFGFASNKIFLSMVAALTLPGTFWTYSCVSVVGLIVLYFFLPETEGKTLYEITQHFAGERRLDNKVFKKRKETLEGATNAGFTLDCAPDDCKSLECTSGRSDMLELEANFSGTGKRKRADANHA